MRIVHLSVERQCPPGLRKQLAFEASAAQTLEGVIWHTLAYHTGAITEPFLHPIPKLFRSLFMRKLYGWIVALRLRRQYDIVMMRHMTFDPFSLIFAPFISNRVSVHHAKEVEELKVVRAGWKGKAASIVERVVARVAARNAMMILGVTREIAEYERKSYAPNKKIGVYPNGIDPAQVKLIQDARQPDAVKAAFICSEFVDWHGLDKLIEAVDAHEPSSDEPPLTIHLIGLLTAAQLREIEATERRRQIFRAHGVVDVGVYSEILATCDMAITSLALERKALVEASTLKVREMLGMGLSVYSGHKDVALPCGQPFVRICQAPSVSDLLSFGRETKALSRMYVREQSLERIDKRHAMLSALEAFRSLGDTSSCIR